jgi:hypothetical protein
VTDRGFIPPRAANDDVSGTVHNLSDGTPVIGRKWDTDAARQWQGHTVIDLRANPNANEIWEEAYEAEELRPDGNPVTEPGWSPELNRDWVNSIIDNRSVVRLATEPAGRNLWSDKLNQPAVFADEINQFKSAGYQQIDDYLVPGELAEEWRQRH